MNIFARLRRLARPLLAVAIVAAVAILAAGDVHAATTLAPTAVSLLQETIGLPGWFVGAAPALAYGINYLILKMGGDSWSPGQKENVVFAVNASLFAALVLTGQVAPPEARPTDNLLASWWTYVGAWFVYIHKGSNAIADIMKASRSMLTRLA